MPAAEVKACLEKTAIWPDLAERENSVKLQAHCVQFDVEFGSGSLGTSELATCSPWCLKVVCEPLWSWFLRFNVQDSHLKDVKMIFVNPARQGSAGF